MADDLHEDEDVRRGLDAAVVRKFLSYVAPYRPLVLRLVVVMLVFSLIDSLAPMLSKIAVDRFAVPRRLDGIQWFAALCIGIALGRGVMNLLMIRTGGRIYTGISHDIRRDCFNHLQELSLSYYDHRPAGWLLARITSDSTRVGRSLSWNMIDVVDGVAKLILMTGLMLVLDVRLALVVLSVVPVMALVIWWCQRISLERFRAVRRVDSEITGALNEGIMGAPTVKTLVREEANLREFGALTMRMRDVSVSAARWSSFYLPLALLLGTVGSALALWRGGTGVLNGTVSYGTLVAFVGYAVAFFQPLQDLARRFPELQNAQAAAERILSLLEAEPEIRDSTHVLACYGAAPFAGAAPLPEFRGEVEFRGVSFHYVPGEPVLAEVDLHVAPGEAIALVGETGAGKTTIANLVARFYEPTAGAILIDGADYRELPLAWLQGHLGIVQQDPHMFSGSVAANIRYGKLDASAEEVVHAATLVSAHPFIAQLPGGYDFDAGEGGRNLSTGQKQLIALARAMLADPRLLILDEATSSVDTETEQSIQQAIGVVLRGRTSLVIAHRLSTIRSADRILLIGDGGIMEQGSHRELLRLDGGYARLYRGQFLEERSMRVIRSKAGTAPQAVPS